MTAAVHLDLVEPIFWHNAAQIEAGASLLTPLAQQHLEAISTAGSSSTTTAAHLDLVEPIFWHNAAQIEAGASLLTPLAQQHLEANSTAGSSTTTSAAYVPLINNNANTANTKIETDFILKTVQR
jgi:hypothetical protein